MNRLVISIYIVVSVNVIYTFLSLFFRNIHVHNNVWCRALFMNLLGRPRTPSSVQGSYILYVPTSFRFGLNNFWYNFEKTLHINRREYGRLMMMAILYSTWDSIILHLYNYTQLSLCNYGLHVLIFAEFYTRLQEENLSIL